MVRKLNYAKWDVPQRLFVILGKQKSGSHAYDALSVGDDPETRVSVVGKVRRLVSEHRPFSKINPCGTSSRFYDGLIRADSR